MIRLDGSNGEGGGQILRSALTLSAATGQPFEINNIRANRPKPGLMRQHLACVRAAADICGAYTEGAELGARSLRFTPGDLRHGTYDFKIGTAGSTCLLFQTVLPALVMADGPSTVTLSGGTHNPAAPTWHMLDEIYLPTLARTGIAVERSLSAYGFFPAGGGAWSATIEPAETLIPLEVLEPGALTGLFAEALLSDLTNDIGKRELKVLKAKLPVTEEQAGLTRVESPGQGNVLSVRVEWAGFRELFSGFGERGLRAEAVAERLCQAVRRYLAAQVPVGPYLADQLLVPLALGAGGRFLTQAPSLHFTTNCSVIEAFLDVDIRCEKQGDVQYLVEVVRR